MRHVSMKSVNFLDLETVVAHTGRAPLEGQSQEMVGHLSLNCLFFPGFPNPNHSCYLQSLQLFHGVPQSLNTSIRVRVALPEPFLSD